MNHPVVSNMLFNSLPDFGTHFAYIDGGTGSMALQAAIAGALSAAFYVKTRWHSIRAIVSRKAKKD